MITDTEIKVKGFEVLVASMGLVEAERFIALVQRELFDYTKWREKGLETDLPVEEISRRARALQQNAGEKGED